jgi:SAM-dependent methyltransferase
MQSAESKKRNVKFFSRAQYAENIGELDTYKLIRERINGELHGIRSLLDVGNGGVFDYDTSLVESIVGVDLFLPSTPLPPNVSMRAGDAVSLPFKRPQFDAVMMVMLLHHLAGKTAAASEDNLRAALSEARRVALPQAKIIVVESCVPAWFFRMQKLVFPLSSRLVSLVLSHPAVLQYTAERIVQVLREAGFVNIRREAIPLGKYVLQFGVKWPSRLTPVYPMIFTATA